MPPYLRFLLILPPVFLIFVLVKGNLFSIEKIDCKTQYGPCSERDIETLETFQGKNLFLLPQTDVRKSLGENFLNRQVSMQKIFPNRLEIVIEKRKPAVALVQSPIAEMGFFLLDQDGVVVEVAKETILPVLTLPVRDENMELGKEVGQEIKKAAKILSLVYGLRKTKETRLESNFLYVKDLDGIEIFFPLNQDPEVSVGALQLIITRSRIEGSLPKTIDLRYSNPVLKY